MRLPYALVLYAVPLISEIKRRGYRGKLNAEPALVDGGWCLELTYEADGPPAEVPERWHGHRVVVKKAAPPPEPEARR